jgi:PAS domain S-box-containing protein
MFSYRYRGPVGPGWDHMIDLKSMAVAETMEWLRTAGSHPIVQSFPHGALIVFDHDLRYLCAGGLGLAEVGLSRDLLEGNTVFDVFPSDVASVIEPLYRRALAGDESAVDVPFAGRIYLQRLSPVRDDDGMVVAGMGFTQDVTDGRRREQQLSESEDRFRLSFDYAPFAMALIGLDGRYERVNPAMCNLTGYSAEQLMGMSIADITHPDDLAADLAGVAGLIAGELSSVVMEKRYLTSAGNVVWTAKSATLARDAGGRPLYVISQLKDISARKMRDEALLERDRRLQEAESVGRVGSWELDLTTQAVTWSAGLFDIYGVDPTSFDGTLDASLDGLHADDVASVQAAVEACSRTGYPLRVRYRLTRQTDGALRWFDARGQAIRKDGRLIRITGVVADVTEQVQADAAKNEFLGRMSHELRTPMNAILGFAQLLELDTLDEHQTEAVQHILRAGSHLVSLIDDVLDIANIEDDRLDVTMEAVAVTDVLRETATVMAPAAAAADIRIDCQPDTSRGLWVQGDARRLRQVLFNLLSNAIKYNRPGGRVVVRATLGQHADAPRVDISVQDTGIGISPADLPRVFTPFDRLGAQAHGIDGTGIGLALSQRLMRMMDGNLSVTSELGLGCTFTASLPLGQPPESVPSSEAADGQVSSPADLNAVRQMCLLYVKDNSFSMELMTSLIARRPQWRMVVADSEAPGHDLAIPGSPDLVLLDLHRPDLAGVDVLERLRADPVTQDLEIVVASADAKPSQINRLLRAGANGYLTRPLEVAEIVDLLDSCSANSTSPFTT